MRIRFYTQKINSISDYFNIGFHKDSEEDYCIAIMLFGRDFVWRFFKKDSEWAIESYTDEDVARL